MILEEIHLYNAIVLATLAHLGQVDKSNIPYIEHPLRVATAADSLEKKIVAILHDVVEDSSITLLDIKASFGEKIANAVDAITHKHKEPKYSYYQRVRSNALAHAVKLLDIADNLREERLAVLDEPTRTHLITKYELAMKVLAND